MTTDMSTILPPDLAERVARMMGVPVVSWRLVRGGYTPALRGVATFADGRTFFVKAGVNELTAGWLRQEHHVYQHLQADFLPQFFGFADDETAPVLVLEDLSHAHWPPPWLSGQIRAVQETLAHVHTTTPPPGIPRVDESEAVRQEFTHGWQTVADNPAPLLSLGLCDADWLSATLPALHTASERVPLRGDNLLHLDTRSDNMCITQRGRIVLVDWNWACIGNGDFDLIGWLPSLSSETGLLPEELLPNIPNGGAWAASLAGFWAAKAGLPAPDGAPHVRSLQRTQLAVTLRWAARALGLPPPVPTHNLTLTSKDI